MVTGGWQNGARGWDIYMANKGYIMFTIDNRGSSNRGLEFENVTFRHLGIEEGKDQVTLFTCTPYGVNSHRLLVRGTRVPYNGEEDATESVTDSMVKAIQNYYMLYLILGLSITILVIILLRFLSKRKAHKE